MSTFKQCLLGAVMLASLFCSVMLLMMGLYLAGGVLAFVCLFCVFHIKKHAKQLDNQSVTQNVSRETSEEI